MKTHHYLRAKRKSVMRGALCFVASKVTSSYSREKQQIARPLSIAASPADGATAQRNIFFHFLGRGGNSTGHLAETDSVIITFTPAGDREDVTVFQPFSRFAAWQFQRIRPPPSQLEQATP